MSSGDARAADLASLDSENQIVFHGYAAAGITGMTETSSHDAIVIART
jgi:hypothetical protein